MKLYHGTTEVVARAARMKEAVANRDGLEFLTTGEGSLAVTAEGNPCEG
jgi:hypothetical protein